MRPTVAALAGACVALLAAAALADPVGDDGAGEAPVADIPHPQLLADFAPRPPWRVAGVDYPVGRPKAAALRRPTRENLPVGAELRGEAIYVSGRDVTLDGFDLDGLTVMIEDAASGVARLRNCEAGRGVVIRSTVRARAEIVVERCTLDGAGARGDPNFQTIKVWCPLTVLYSWIRNSPGGIQSGAALTAKDNLLEGFAWTPGAHANAIYVQGADKADDRTVIAYNTIYSQSARNPQGFPVGIGAAIAFFGDGGDFHHSRVSRNVVISALPGAASYLIGFYVEAGAAATGGEVVENYLASVNGFGAKDSGAFGAFYPGAKGVVQARFAGNVEMIAERPAAR